MTGVGPDTAALGNGDDFARRFASGERIEQPVAVVVAHPDDESLWSGSLLARLDAGLLIHVTDGAPFDMGDARRQGFRDREAYAAARAAEIDAALTALGVSVKRASFGVVDQRAVNGLAMIVDRLASELRRFAVVVTHPYEAGHPDHDACALAVGLAVQRLASAAEESPAIVEFACYNAFNGERRFGEFAGAPVVRAYERPLDPAERVRVADALAAHRTQRGVIGGWVPTHERWRAAPAYDFTRPPPGPALYDGFGWEITSERWCAVAAAAMNGQAPLA